MNRTLLPFLVLLLTLAGCQRQRPEPKAPPPPVVTVTNPVLHGVQSYYEYNGNLEAMETVQVRARVKGILKEVLFTEGSEVEAGEVLFLIDPREYEANVKKAKAERAKAKALADQTESEAKRAMGLFESKAISEEDLIKARAARDTAAAILLQTEALVEIAELEMSYTKITAPIAGRISRALVTKGNLVGQTEATLLTTIVSVDPLYVFFDAPEREQVEYQRALRDKMTVSSESLTIPVEIGVTSEEGYPHKGKIDFRENRVDIGTGTVRIRGRIPNPLLKPGNARLLYPGLYSRVRVPRGEPRMLPAIPEDALMTGQEGRYVYVLNKDNVVEKRSVVVGAQIFKGLAKESESHWVLEGPDGKETLVTSVVAIEEGLSPEDRVVVNGVTRARPGAPVAPLNPVFKLAEADKSKK